MAPSDRRIEQIGRAEKLHDTIDRAVNYPFDYLQFQITGRRSVEDESTSTVLVGEAIKPDLRLIIDALSRSVDMAPDVSVQSPAELASRLNVSTKTIERWRKKGLRWRWVARAPGQRKRIAFMPDAVEHFLAEQGDRVQRASTFTQMDPQVKQRIVDRARRIRSVREVSFNRVASHLARRTGRGLQTVRVLLQQHDREHPEDAIFADHVGPMTQRDNRAIARAYRRGVSVADLARQYRRTRAAIYRAIHLRRAAVLQRVKISFVAEPTFVREDADEVILRPAPADMSRDTDARIDDLPAPLARIYSQPSIDSRHLRSLFVRYNYLKYKAAQRRDALDRHHPRAADIETAENCIRQAGVLRNQLISANLHVVLSVAQRHMIDQPDASVNRLLRLLDLGNDVLRKQVEQYDAGRRQTFETSLTWQLQREFASQQAVEAESSRAVRRVSAEQIAAKLPRG